MLTSHTSANYQQATVRRLEFITEEETEMMLRFHAIARMACAIVFVFAALLIPMSARSQELRGKISGRVVDSTGAAVPGASVKVTSLARAATTTLTTNGDGLFDAPYLLPGSYQVIVEASGFKKSILDKVEVAIN